LREITPSLLVESRSQPLALDRALTAGRTAGTCDLPQGGRVAFQFEQRV